jgi:hypothetical protein
MQRKISLQESLEDLRAQAYDDFVSFLNNLFYEGYAEELAEAYPADFTQQLNEYFENHFGYAV